MKIKKYITLLAAAAVLFCLFATIPAASAAESTKTLVVAATNNHSLALKADGTVWSWGSNWAGQLGLGTTTDRNAPTQITTLSNIVAIAAGTAHSVAIDENGEVWAWGRNYYGQLGDGTTKDSKVPVKISGISDVVAISAANHTVALKTDGTVWTWGDNAYGKLGIGSVADKGLTPAEVSGITEAKKISANANHTLVLKEDGTVCAWGSNWAGNLGDGTKIDSNVPVDVDGLTDIKAIAAGYYHSVAISEDGSVWAWGNNTYGQLGNPGTGDFVCPFPMLVDDIFDAVEVVANDHTVILKSDGTVWTFGRNDYGQLGVGTVKENSFKPKQVEGLTDVIGIAAGLHTMAARSYGKTSEVHKMEIWAWGRNNFGQIGDGTDENRLQPVQVKGENAVDRFDSIAPTFLILSIILLAVGATIIIVVVVGVIRGLAS